MPSITSSGIGSGLDVQGLVQQLVAAERGPQQSLLDRQTTVANARISAFGQLQSVLSQLSSSLAGIKSGSSLGARTATAANPGALTATASNTAVAGAYSVEVRGVAGAHRLTSSAYAASTDLIGTGTLTLAFASTSFSLTLDATSGTMARIRDAINAAPANTGVDATILNTADGPRLTLSARATGAANAIRVTRSGGNGGLDALVYNPGVLTNMAQTSAATDAEIFIDTYRFTSATNQFSGAIGGVTINALAVAPVTTLTIARDNGTARSSVQGMVTAYNNALAQVRTLTAYNADTRQGSVLTGDSMARTAAADLRNLATSAVPVGGTNVARLSDIGISGAVDGKLTLDTAKFDQALAADPVGVAAFLKEFGTRLDVVADSYADSNGRIDGRTEGLRKRLTDIDQRKRALDTRMLQVEARYRAQFTALDSLVAGMRNTSDFLAQQLAGLRSLR